MCIHVSLYLAQKVAGGHLLPECLGWAFCHKLDEVAANGPDGLCKEKMGNTLKSPAVLAIIKKSLLVAGVAVNSTEIFFGQLEW